MSNPTEKHPRIENLIGTIFGVDRRANICQNKCVFCKGNAEEFKDELSRKEFSISGLCQKCQDKVFG